MSLTVKKQQVKEQTQDRILSISHYIVNDYGEKELNQIDKKLDTIDSENLEKWVEKVDNLFEKARTEMIKGKRQQRKKIDRELKQLENLKR